ncbi:YqjF family protein [Arthrobacter sp. NPDC092385]|uniref:YqjF family protein n=1 Tax=Arthrobacter sp. NPDC092385 TaxID=3363943 RepID=UPI00382894CF
MTDHQQGQELYLAPDLPRPVIMDQSWLDAVFLHWRIDPAAVAGFMPPGVVPDEVDGSSWVGLIGFRMVGAGLGRGLPLPYFGSFAEINVRLYSRGPDGTRGVVFVTLDASRLAVVLAARAGGIPYVWSKCSPIRRGEGAQREYGYDVVRYRRQATSRFAVRPQGDRTAEDTLSLELTARFGLHSTLAGRTLYIPNTHAPWPLHPATLTEFDDGLLGAAGLRVEGPPESVLYSPGVQTQFGKPRVVSC